MHDWRCETEEGRVFLLGLLPSFLAFCGFATQCLWARALPSLVFAHLGTWNNIFYWFLVQTIFQLCQDVIQSQYVLGVQRIQRYGNSLEFKLLGNPWNCGIDGHDGLHGRSLICHLINALASRSWRPVTSADVSAKYVHQDKGPDYPIDVDSIFFAHDPTPVQPSAPPPMPYFQSYSQPYGPPPSYGSLQYNNPPRYDPPAYGGFAKQ